ncbi:hypothetical protein M9H77_15615 [Catharanthus roseus]|uniref:Uncharacterized protein n=1 Tax=Catharanthus roseus TaxID=4058 RepID=A0ACC0B0E8_CATRO|nr:hypothetical protein M9H77_15615 [Catharanthus roseus]
MEEEVKLHGFWASPYVYKVIWALKLKAIKYDYIEEDLSDKSELLLHYNPIHKKVPVLVHGGKPIAESDIVLEYIEETWVHNPLLPKDPFDRALARFWIHFGSQNGWTFYCFFIASEAGKEAAAKEVVELLKLLEEKCLGNKKFFGGDEINMVDLSFGWLTLWFDCIEQVVGMKILEPTNFPRLCSWAMNFKEHPLIKENLPQPGKLLLHYQNFKERYGNK